MKLPRNRKDDYSPEVLNERLKFLGEQCGCSLSWLNSSRIDPHLARGNIENLIGFAQVPIGAVGPLRVNGEHASGEFFVPLGTTEGTLISSFNRGARVITLSGGANVLLVKDNIQRAPFFELEDLWKARDFVAWIESRFGDLQKVAQSTTTHGKLVSYHSYIQGRIVFLRLDFSTGDSMGMNMISKASLEVCKYIAAHFPIIRYSLEGNMAVDKKPAYINSILGRGKSVVAEVVIKEHIVRRFLHTTAKDIERNYRQEVMGALLSGAMGMNGHLANGIAALFLACGQDLANVSDSCVGYSYAEDRDGELYISVNMPSLMVGTVGGGVSLPTQRECLEILGCYGNGKSRKFAEIVAATVMAGEISLIASLTAGDFVSAHERYGRNRPG